MAERIKLERGGENPHQEAWKEVIQRYGPATVFKEPIHGKPLGYNNLQDANAALEVLMDMSEHFSGIPSAVVLKHKNPCGLATATTLRQALEYAWRGDEVSSFGSVVGFSRTVNRDVIERTKGKFIEVIVAPDYDQDALDWVNGEESKKDLRLIETDNLIRDSSYVERHEMQGGALLQTRDDELYLGNVAELLFSESITRSELKGKIGYVTGPVSKRRFEKGMEKLFDFSVIAGKHIKSNSVSIVYECAQGNYRILGMGAGQPNRKASVELALKTAREGLMREYFRERSLDYAMVMNDFLRGSEDGKKVLKDAYEYANSILSSNKTVLFTDSFFPFPDGLVTAANGGIRYIATPGGSIKDKEVIEAADRENVALVFTGRRHFRH